MSRTHFTQWRPSRRPAHCTPHHTVTISNTGETGILVSSTSAEIAFLTLLTLLLSLVSILSLQEGLRSCLSGSGVGAAAPAGPVTRVAEAVRVVEVAVLEGWDGGGVGVPGGVAVLPTCCCGVGEPASCCSSVVRWAFSCCCFFFTNCSADLRSSSVTPCKQCKA